MYKLILTYIKLILYIHCALKQAHLYQNKSLQLWIHNLQYTITLQITETALLAILNQPEKLQLCAQIDIIHTRPHYTY